MWTCPAQNYITPPCLSPPRFKTRTFTSSTTLSHIQDFLTCRVSGRVMVVTCSYDWHRLFTESRYVLPVSSLANMFGFHTGETATQTVSMPMSSSGPRPSSSGATAMKQILLRRDMTAQISNSLWMVANAAWPLVKNNQIQSPTWLCFDE